MLIVLQEIRIRDLQAKIDWLKESQKGLLDLTEKEFKAIKEVVKFVEDDHQSVHKFIDDILSSLKDSEK